MSDLIWSAGVILLGFVFISMAIVIVPQQRAYIVERLGSYHETFSAGPHFIIPFIDRIAYRFTLQEVPMDSAPQEVTTRDNVTVQMDGIIFYQVTDPKAAAYGTTNIKFAIESLAKTAMRAQAGKMQLDELFEGRQQLNGVVVTAIDEAATNWGVKVKRFEVKDIKPPANVLASMQKQMEAERDKRARIAQSEGVRTEQINIAEGQRQAAISASEGQRQAAINRADGEAAAILKVAEATAEALRKVGEAIGQPGGERAVQMKVAEKYVDSFGQIAKAGTTVVVPANMGDMASLVTAGMEIFKSAKTMKT